MNPNKELEAQIAYFLTVAAAEGGEFHPNGALTKRVVEFITQSQHIAVQEFAEGLMAASDECYDIDNGGEAFNALPVEVISTRLSAYLKEGR